MQKTQHEKDKELKVAKKMTETFVKREYICCEYCDHVTLTKEFMAGHLTRAHNTQVTLEAIK